MKSFYTESPVVFQYEDGQITNAVKALKRMSPHQRGTLVLFTGMSASEGKRAAEELSTQLKLELRRIDPGLIVSKYIGETEKNLRELIARSSTSNVILFFDEADALFGKRSEVKDSHDRYANIGVSYLLGRLESYQGIVMLAVKSSTLLVRARNGRRTIIFRGDDRAD